MPFALDKAHIVQLFDTSSKTVLAHVLAPSFALQVAIVVVAGVVAFLLAPRLRRLTTRIIHLLTPKTWNAPMTRALGSVAPPLLWLGVVWVSVLVANSFGHRFGFANAAASLLAAWVTIRLFSFAVRSPLWSATVSLIAWSIAALSILGLLSPLAQQLDASAIHIGNYRLSGLTIVRGIFLVVVLLWLTAVISAFLEQRIKRAATLTPSIQALLMQIMRILLPVVAILVALAAVGVDFTALTVLSGAIGIGVGLGLQRTVANFVAGLALILSESIRPGDVIKYKESYGWVTSMGARYVGLRTRDGIEYLVPNDYFLENGVENWSHSDHKLRLHVPVGIAYESDLKQAMALCVDAARSVKRVLDRPEPACLLHGFGESSIDLEIRAWIEDPRGGTANVRSEILLAVWERFQKAGITLPFPQRDVHVIPVPAPSSPPPAQA